MKNNKAVQRILAWIGIVFLVALYVITLILALIKHPLAQMLFRGSLYMTIMIPFLLYAFILVYKILSRKNNEAAENPEGEK